MKTYQVTLNGNDGFRRVLDIESTSMGVAVDKALEGTADMTIERIVHVGCGACPMTSAIITQNPNGTYRLLDLTRAHATNLDTMQQCADYVEANLQGQVVKWKVSATQSVATLEANNPRPLKLSGQMITIDYANQP